MESRWGRDLPHPSRPALEAHPASYTIGTGSFPRVKRPGRGVDHPPHLAPMLKKEYSYTSTPPLGLRGLFWGELYLFTIFNKRAVLRLPFYSNAAFQRILLLHTANSRIFKLCRAPDGNFQPIKTTYITYPQCVDDFQKAL